MPSVKIACIGAGSQYFARALGDLAVARDLAGSEITLYDIDVPKAEIMARHGARLAGLSGTGLRVRACASLADAVDGARFAVTSIGGAGRSAGGVYGTGFHNADVMIPAKYGIHHPVGDTGGPAGMMMALRSVPAYIEICREMEKRCPEAILLNHSNPMAVVCRAMLKYTGVDVIGVCHGVQGGIVYLGELLGVDPTELETVWIGTNHYHWFTRIRHQGRDAYPEVRRRIAERGPRPGGVMTQKLSDAYGYQIAYPHDDHICEFYSFFAHLRGWDDLPYGLQARDEQASYVQSGTGPASDEREERQAYLAELADWLGHLDIPRLADNPITGEGLAGMLEDILLGRRRVHIVNVPNRGSVPNLPDYAVLEVEGVTDSAGVRPIYTGEAPLSLAGLLQKRIAWQELVVEAAVKGDRNLALQALLLDESAIRPELAEAMLAELLAASRDLLPQFAQA